MQEITGAKPVRDTKCIAPKALSAMRSLGKRNSPVQLQVRAPITQSSQRSSRHHKPAQPRAALGIATILPPCSSLRISFVKNSCRGSTGWRLQVSCFTGEWLRGNSRPRRSRVCESRRRGMQVLSRPPSSWSRSHSRPAPGFYPDMVRLQLPPAPPIPCLVV